MDEILSREDVAFIVEKIIGVQAKSEVLGRRLKVQSYRVDSILQQYRDPQDQLFHIIDEFVRQVEPKPTWRTILEALRSPLIGEAALAQEIQMDLFPDTFPSGAVSESSVSQCTVLQPRSTLPATDFHSLHTPGPSKTGTTPDSLVSTATPCASAGVTAHSSKTTAPYYVNDSNPGKLSWKVIEYIDAVENHPACDEGKKQAIFTELSDSDKSVRLDVENEHRFPLTINFMRELENWSKRMDKKHGDVVSFYEVIKKDIQQRGAHAENKERRKKTILSIDGITITDTYTKSLREIMYEDRCVSELIRIAEEVRKNVYHCVDRLNRVLHKPFPRLHILRKHLEITFSRFDFSKERESVYSYNQ